MPGNLLKPIMKIVTWNCNMAFRKKAELILGHNPDLVIVPECEHPDRLKFKPGILQPTNVIWFGENRNKGLGIFSYSGFKLKVHKEYNPAFKLVIPISVTNQKIKLTLYAIWANNPADGEGRYITQIWKAVNYYEKLLRKGKSVLVGDFNSNTIWDKPRREGNHSTVVEFLQKKGIHSTYHHHHKQAQGKEPHPTFYLYRQLDKPYHLDYCFASDQLIERLESVEVGEFEEWRAHSDHVPVIVNFRL